MRTVAKWVTATVSVGTIGLLLTAASDQVQGKGPAQRPAGQSGGGMGGKMQGKGGMMQGQGMGPMDEQPNMGPGQGMFGDAGAMNMPEPMRMRHRMFMEMRMCPNDPAALLALKGDLKLTKEQIAALEKILDDAQTRAAAVLTPTQVKKLDPVAATPDNARDMQRQMMQGKGKGKGMGRAGKRGG